MWPQLCQRARRLWARYTPYMPAEAILQDWFARLTQTPNIMWVALLVENGRIVGHCVSAVEMYYTKPFVFVYQLEIDRPDLGRQFKAAGIEAMLEWINGMNHALEEGESPVRIEAIRFLTPRTPRGWKSWLPFDCLLEENVLTFGVPGMKVES